MIGSTVHACDSHMTTMNFFFGFDIARTNKNHIVKCYYSLSEIAPATGIYSI